MQSDLPVARAQQQTRIAAETPAQDIPSRLQDRKEQRRPRAQRGPTGSLALRLAQVCATALATFALPPAAAATPTMPLVIGDLQVPAALPEATSSTVAGLSCQTCSNEAEGVCRSCFAGVCAQCGGDQCTECLVGGAPPSSSKRPL